MELTNLTNLTKAKEAPGAADLAIGIVLTLFGAVTLALSMTIQRYALAHPSPTIPYCGLQLKKSWVWGFGLLLYLFANVFKVIGLMFGPMTVLSSVFTTLLIFNLVIANRLLDERITPPKVAGAVLILIGAGLCTTATPEGVPENYTPDDVIELIARPPPFGWFLMALMASFAGGSLIVMLRVERRFPIRDDTGLIHEEHAIPHAALVVAERRMSIGPGTFLRRPSPPKRQDSSRQHPGEWLRARAIAAQHLEEEEGSEIRLRAERTRSQQIAVGNPRRSWGALSNMSSLSVSFSSIRRPSRKGSSRKVLPMGALPETDSCRANEMADGAAPAVPGLAFVPPPLSPTPKSSPPAAKGTALPTTPASATATEKSTPSLREFSKPAPNPNPNPPMPPWLDRLMAILYPASLGVDEALADLCVRGYSSMLATGVPGAVQTWVLYVMVVIGTVAGVLSAVFYMPYVYRRYETTVALPIEYGALNAGNIASGLLFYGEAQYMRAWQYARGMLFRGVEGSEGSVAAFWSTCQYLGHDAPQLEDALIFASSAHAGQRRKSGEPYIVHPIETATILAELRMDTDTVIAGLLHDTVEDTDVSADDIRRRFGNGVANIVEGVTDGPKGVPDETNQCALLLAMSMDWRIVLVKLADRLHNMRTLGAMPREKQIRKAQETMSIFVPLAREVGVSQLEEELEMRCAQALFPQLFSPLETLNRMASRRHDTHPPSDAALLPPMRDVTRTVLGLLSGAARLYCPAQLDSLLSRDETLDAFDAAERISSHRQRWAEHLDKHFVLSDAL